ncbi:hypothetical protein H8K52_15710 [Undibacterium seohonense]|uniref:Uncharacterized protein n=2 Tax=Undibacterium seohonense TaxID=1344950 RepID=A0ABR6X754_9BURK|nr:hypothetical protein [Undibacterium seohonense]
MKNQNTSKLFAFKLAEKKAEKTQITPQWKVRDGVAIAGCSGPDARAPRLWNGRKDDGIWC